MVFLIKRCAQYRVPSFYYKTIFNADHTAYNITPYTDSYRPLFRIAMDGHLLTMTIPDVEILAVL